MLRLLCGSGYVSILIYSHILRYACICFPGGRMKRRSWVVSSSFFFARGPFALTSCRYITTTLLVNITHPSRSYKESSCRQKRVFVTAIVKCALVPASNNCSLSEHAQDQYANCPFTPGQLPHLHRQKILWPKSPEPHHPRAGATSRLYQFGGRKRQLY